MKKLLIVVMFITAHTAWSQNTNWANVDFVKEYKVKSKIGPVSKSLKKNPTFINNYYVTQVSHMKGSSKAGVMQKQGVGSIFAEAVLGGVSQEALQQLTNELHAEFVKELKAIGLNITDGSAAVNSEYAQGKKDDKNSIIGKGDGKGAYEKLGVLDTDGYDTKERYHFRPADQYSFVTTKNIPGNFYNKLAAKEEINLITIGYVIKFADFDGSKSITKNTLTTSPALRITPTISFTNPKAAWGWIEFGKAVEGDNEWSKGLIETKSRDGQWLGLSSSADYAIEADEAKYIAELKAIVLNLQKDIAALIKAEL